MSLVLDFAPQYKFQTEINKKLKQYYFQHLRTKKKRVKRKGLKNSLQSRIL